MNGIQILDVACGSLAEMANLSAGDILLKVNGETVLDNLNYQFLVSRRDITEVTVKKQDGSQITAKLENGGNALGLKLAQDKMKVCRQNCIFCFVQQMPPGFRESLYIKDEDIRLSFLNGNFTTLSNTDDAELNRIQRERLSPIHVSVHATDPKARALMVGNAKHGDILKKIDRLVSGGIQLHTQAVIVPGFNDGEIWERTLSDLWHRRALDGKGHRGGVLSLSCVPVGLTHHRQHLPPLREIDSGYALNWARLWKKRAYQYARQWDGRPWLLLADEWFTRARQKVPGRNFYPPDWNQIENGIGLVRRFQEHSKRFIRSERAKGFNGLRLLALTGSSFAPYLSDTIEALNRSVRSRIIVVPVANNAFGASVTVAGLLCGKDLLSAAQKHLHGSKNPPFDAIIVPSTSIRLTVQNNPNNLSSECSGQFLDNMTTAEMQSILNIPVVHGGENLSRLLSNVKKAAKQGGQ